MTDEFLFLELSCLHLLIIVNTAIMKIGLQIAIRVSTLNRLVYICKSRIAESYDNSICNFFKETPQCSP